MTELRNLDARYAGGQREKGSQPRPSWHWIEKTNPGRHNFGFGTYVTNVHTIVTFLWSGKNENFVNATPAPIPGVGIVLVWRLGIAAPCFPRPDPIAVTNVHTIVTTTGAGSNGKTWPFLCPTHVRHRFPAVFCYRLDLLDVGVKSKNPKII